MKKETMAIPIIKTIVTIIKTIITTLQMTYIALIYNLNNNADNENENL